MDEQSLELLKEFSVDQESTFVKNLRLRLDETRMKLQEMSKKSKNDKKKFLALHVRNLVTVNPIDTFSNLEFHQVTSESTMIQTDKKLIFYVSIGTGRLPHPLTQDQFITIRKKYPSDIKFVILRIATFSSATSSARSAEDFASSTEGVQNDPEVFEVIGFYYDTKENTYEMKDNEQSFARLKELFNIFSIK